MIKLIGKDRQLFVTTHNSDITEMFIPFHSFAFLRRDDSDHHRISVMYASDLLKKNTESLKNAIDNDLFLASPDVDDVFLLAEE
ncbi:MAG: ATP-binding protein, partial [Clostridia bacterium]|nr:ATP-binding protein [Clostridia bacterium]